MIKNMKPSAGLSPIDARILARLSDADDASYAEADRRDAAVMDELAADLTSYGDRHFSLATRGMSFRERMGLIG